MHQPYTYIYLEQHIFTYKQNCGYIHPHTHIYIYIHDLVGVSQLGQEHVFHATFQGLWTAQTPDPRKFNRNSSTATAPRILKTWMWDKHMCVCVCMSRETATAAYWFHQHFRGGNNRRPEPDRQRSSRLAHIAIVIAIWCYDMLWLLCGCGWCTTKGPILVGPAFYGQSHEPGTDAFGGQRCRVTGHVSVVGEQFDLIANISCW